MTADATRTGAPTPDLALRPTVEQLMRPAVTTVEPSAHLAGAAYLIKRSGDTALVVLSDENSRRPISIITDTDISQAVADGKDLQTTRISDLHHAAPVTVDRSATVEAATRLMLSHGIHHVPVLGDGRLVGMVDMSALCAALLQPGERGPDA